MGGWKDERMDESIDRWIDNSQIHSETLEQETYTRKSFHPTGLAHYKQAIEQRHIILDEWKNGNG